MRLRVRLRVRLRLRLRLRVGVGVRVRVSVPAVVTCGEPVTSRSAVVTWRGSVVRGKGYD